MLVCMCFHTIEHSNNKWSFSIRFDTFLTLKLQIQSDNDELNTTKHQPIQPTPMEFTSCLSSVFADSNMF